MPVTKTARLVFSDLGKNSYKYYNIELRDDGTVVSTFGVVGVTNPQSCNYGAVGEAFYDKKIREKEKKGYTHARIVASGPGAQAAEVSRGSLADIALSQIKFSNEAIRGLIKRLVDANVHRICSSTSVEYNQATGVFASPLGILTREAIDEARIKLVFFNDKTSIDSEYKKRIDEYLRLVPRNKGHRLSYERVFPDKTALQKESDLLDALQNSLDLISAPAPAVQGAKVSAEQVFKLKLDRLDDDKERGRIEDWYENTKKSMHHYDKVKVREIYAIDIPEFNSRFKGSVGNIQEVYSGTSESNVLSILKSGLLTQPPTSAAVAGKLFLQGVYGSQTSSKALGYTLNRWGQGAGNSGWLFLCEFAMGRPFYATTYGISRMPDPKHYDSCWALPKNITGLHNDELIVYSTDQIKMKYLLEVK